MIQRLSIRHLRTLRVLYDTKSMCETAEIVGRSQPAISLQIKDLEEIVGFRLIYHRRGMIVFTEQGEAFANLARQTEAQLSDRIETIRGTSETSLRFAVTHDIHDACRNEIGIFAEYGISLEAMTSNEILSGISEGTIDAGIAKSSVPIDNAAASWTYALNWAGNPDTTRNGFPLKLVLLDVGCFYHHLALTLFAHTEPGDVELVICENWAEIAEHLMDGGVTIISAGWIDIMGATTYTTMLPELPPAVLNLWHRPPKNEPAMKWGISRLSAIVTTSLAGRSAPPSGPWTNRGLKALVSPTEAATRH